MNQQETLEMLVQVRLTHMANQYEHLLNEGLIEEARIVREEGLMLASAHDEEEEFLVINFESQVN